MAVEEPGEAVQLWSDDPAEFDLLSFSAISETVVEALLDDALDPLAIGLSGSWGSGKTTVLRLIEGRLAEASVPEEQILVVATDPWRYDPIIGVKETLIAEVLAAVGQHLETEQGVGEKTLDLLKGLARRVDWARAVRIAAKGALAFQLPSFDEVVNIIRPAEEAGERSPGLDEFRSEFRQLLETEELKKVKRVVVLVDDLDRCLPETVIETLEAIRLFLAVAKMSFVLAADESRVAEAIRTRFEAHDPTEDAPEEPAALYLHKIVQTTVPIPSLSHFDTEAYLVLLQIVGRLTDDQRTACIATCEALRRSTGDLDDLAKPAEQDISEEILFAARLTPILYEKLRGNPRRIKRFLNDLRVRQSVAAKRGIELDAEVIAKLMVLEVLLPEAFQSVLEWLARNELRERIAALEAAAGRPEVGVEPIAHGGEAPPETSESATETEEDEDEKVTPLKGLERSDETARFSDEMLRWAKLPPALANVDLGPYLLLAAAFTGRALLDEGLQVRLRDLASNLVSSVRAEQKAVKDEDLRALTTDDARSLVQHLGRVARDRPHEQVAAVTGMLRLGRLLGAVASDVATTLEAIPGRDLEPGTALLFSSEERRETYSAVLKQWQKRAAGPTKGALDSIIGKT